MFSFLQLLFFLTFLLGVIFSSKEKLNSVSNGLPSNGKTVNYNLNEKLQFEEESTSNQFSLLYRHHKNVIRIYKQTGKISFTARKYFFPICKILFLTHQTWEKRWALFAEMEKIVHSEPNFISFLFIFYFDAEGTDYGYRAVHLDLYSDILRKKENIEFSLKRIHSGTLDELQSLAKRTPEAFLPTLCSIYNSILMHCEHILRSRDLNYFYLNPKVYYDLKECRDFGMGVFPIEPQPEKKCRNPSKK
jgi:hypothetical protein